MKVNINKINEFLEKREQEKQKVRLSKQPKQKEHHCTISATITKELYKELKELCDKKFIKINHLLKILIIKEVQNKENANYNYYITESGKVKTYEK